MPIKGIASVTSIGGCQEVISATITGQVDTVEIEPGTANTAITVVTYFNPRYNLSLSGLSDGTTISPFIVTVACLGFKVTSFNISESVGDIKKVDISGVYYPPVTTA